MPISPTDFWIVVDGLGKTAQEDIAWCENVGLPSTAEQFAKEAIFVICNSGMKHTVATRIFERCMVAISTGDSVSTVFGHKGKAAAIDHVWSARSNLFGRFLATAREEQLAFLGALPFVGDITKYHLAKNCGLDVAKPDVHLQRLADREGCTVQNLCERLSKETGLRIATVDTVLWRACATGILDSRTGTFSDLPAGNGDIHCPHRTQ